MIKNDSTKIFVNLAVNDLNKSMVFFKKLGFSINPQFTDETAACVVISEDIYLMILTESKFKQFTKKQIADSKKTTEVLVSLSTESKDQVNEMLKKALEAGATETREPYDYGFMYGRSFEDLDGHIWEMIWVDPNYVQKQPLKELKGMGETNKNNKDLIINRVFDVPIQLVWKVWTNPDMIKKWWGPKDFTAPEISIDFHVGGKYLYCMRGAGLDGVVKDFWNTGKFIEIEPKEKIAATVRFADEHGNPVPASHYGMPGQWPEHIMLTVNFEEVEGGKTKVIVRETGIPEVMNEPARLGWEQSLDKMAQLVFDESKRIASVAYF